MGKPLALMSQSNQKLFTAYKRIYKQNFPRSFLPSCYFGSHKKCPFFSALLLHLKISVFLKCRTEFVISDEVEKCRTEKR